jgi:membrane fusion protein, heavy metal efflux system
MIATNRLHLLGMNRSAINTFLNTSEVAPRYAIHAPIDGQIMQREISHGELVSPEREALCVLADMSSVWVLAEVPEAKLGAVAIGAKAWVSVGSSRPKVLEGQVAFIAPQVNATTRTAQVRIEVATKELPFTLGIFAQVELVLSSSEADPAPVVAVPDVAVQMIAGERFVVAGSFILKADLGKGSAAHEH